MEDLKEPIEKAILVGIDTGAYDLETSFAELEELAEADDVEVLGEISQKRELPDKRTYVGQGKLIEIREMAKALEADLLIFDNELSATQIRNIESETDVRTIDRTMLILDIFSNRAHSSEGRTQVELARQRYLLPRLVGMGKTLSRLGGGGGGGAGARRGAGETQLETDRRHIRRRIQTLEKELENMERHRNELRSRRKKNGVLTVAIVGYTNVGKSSLINQLTGSEVLAKDQLFATLDPTARQLELPDGRNIIMIDTVGLVRRLPHHLVEAFHSTLEEAKDADLILNVCDISSGEAEEQIEVTKELLTSLGAEDVPVITVYNKCDKPHIEVLEGENSVVISVKTGEGIQKLLTKMEQLLPETSKRMNLLFPYAELGLLALLREEGKVYIEEFQDKGVYVEVEVDQKFQSRVYTYEVEGKDL